jgi:hypothetical protein
VRRRLLQGEGEVLAGVPGTNRVITKQISVTNAGWGGGKGGGRTAATPRRETDLLDNRYNARCGSVARAVLSLAAAAMTCARQASGVVQPQVRMMTLRGKTNRLLELVSWMMTR